MIWEHSHQYSACEFISSEMPPRLDAQTLALSIWSGKRHLHKFVSNSKQVIVSLPKEECVEGAADLDLDLGQAKIERAEYSGVWHLTHFSSE